MPVPPEVLFHRYFPRLKSKEDRERYRGKADLDRLPDGPLPRKLLEDVQLMLNAALAAEDRTVPQHVDHDPFHFDYVDSDDPNALAFCCDGYSFLGVTTALLNVLWESASRVAESADLADTLDMRLPDGNAGGMSVEGLAERAARRAGLRNEGLHVLRHTFCSHLAMRGAPARAIQELAGHQDLTTTQRYMHLSPAAIEGAIRLLDQRPSSQGFGDIVETAARTAYSGPS